MSGAARAGSRRWPDRTRSSVGSAGGELHATELEERVALEAAPEEEDPRHVLTLEQIERPGELLARRAEVSLPLGQPAKVQARHREARVEVERHLIVAGRGGEVPGVLVAEGEEVMAAGVEL